MALPSPAPQSRRVDAAEEVRDPLEGLDPPEIPFGEAPYRTMWDQVAADGRERNRFRQLRDFGRQPTTINRRRYFLLSRLEDFDARQAGKQEEVA